MLEKIMFRNLIASKFLLIRKDTDITFTQIESGSTKVGIPDVYFYTSGGIQVQGWIELKQSTKWKKEKDIKVPYRPGQRSFLISHRKSNPRTFVLWYIFGKYHLINRDFKREYKNRKDLEKSCLYISDEIDYGMLIKLLQKGKGE